MKPTLPAATDDDVLDALLAVADRILEQARSHGADAAECFIQTGTGRSLSIERNQLAATEESGEAGIGLRVIKGGRIGFAYFTDPVDTKRPVQRALDAAGKGTKSRLRLPGATKIPTIAGLWDDRIVHRDGQELAEDARALIDGAREVDHHITVAGGSVGVGAEATAIANSEGLQAAHRGTETGAGVYVVAKSGDDVATGQNSHESTTLDATAQDPAGIARIAAERAKELLAATPLEASGKCDVVFTPQAFASILEFMVLPAFLGERAARGESVYAGREKETLADARLRITDDPTRPGGLGSAPTCDEGLPSRSVPLLADGRLGRYLHDLGSAYRWGDGTDSITASGLRTGGLSDGRSYQDPPTATPRQIVLESTDAQDLDALISGIDDGLFVVDVLGAHTGNRTSGDFSVTSTQLWHIKNGERVPVNGAMLAGNLPQLLVDNYLGTSREREQVAGHFTPTGLDLPHIALSGVTRVGS
jgi:PmbA protein